MKKLLLLPLLISSVLLAENTSFWQVQKVKSNDVLNIRSKSDHTSKKVSIIPFNEACVKSHGCGKDIDLESMMYMQEVEVKAFLEQAKTGWCFIEYKGNRGWVNKKFLKASTKPCK